MLQRKRVQLQPSLHRQRSIYEPIQNLEFRSADMELDECSREYTVVRVFGGGLARLSSTAAWHSGQTGHIRPALKKFPPIKVSFVISVTFGESIAIHTMLVSAWVNNDNHWNRIFVIYCTCTAYTLIYIVYTDS